MANKKPITPRSRIRSNLRGLWLRSRERNQALKISDRRCKQCGLKASVAKGKEQKIEVHHIDGIKNWDKLIDSVYEWLLVPSYKLECLCPKCHEKKHKYNGL